MMNKLLDSLKEKIITGIVSGIVLFFLWDINN